MPPNADNIPTAPHLVIDGNSLIHRSYYAKKSSGRRSPDGRSTWALQGFWELLTAAVDRVGAMAVTVALDTTPTYRLDQYPEYKAGRAQKDPQLKAQLAYAPEHLANAGLHVVLEDGYEADDLLASAALRNQTTGRPTVLVTSDRDAFSLINDDGPGVRVLRAINGGPDNWPLLTGNRLEILCGVTPADYRLYASMCGDSSDNLPGVNGIGPKSAAALIQRMKDNSATTQSLRGAIASATDAGSGTNTNPEELIRLVGPKAAKKLLDSDSRRNLDRNLNLMRQVDTLDVGDLDSALLPLSPEPLTTELSRWDLTVDCSSFTLSNEPEGHPTETYDLRDYAAPADPARDDEAPEYDAREFDTPEHAAQTHDSIEVQVTDDLVIRSDLSFNETPETAPQPTSDVESHDQEPAPTLF